jgi:integrase
MLCYQDKGKKFRYFTKLFTSKSPLVSDRIHKPSSLEEMEVNEKLSDLSRMIFDIMKELSAGGYRCTAERVETLFRCKIDQKQDKQEIGRDLEQSDFFSLYDQFVDQNRSIKSRSTIYHYQICKKTLVAFERLTNTPITFEKINSQFYQLFQNYLITERKYLNNTVGGHIKNFKVFLNYAVRNGFTNVQFNFKDFKTINEEIEIIALTETELLKIYQLEDLSNPEKVARDYLCFECFTGLRFSDIGRLKNENIKDDFIVLKTQKTKDNLYIPINVFAREILNKYKGVYKDRPLPPPFANQVINRYIKDVAKKAEIDDLTMVEKFNGATRLTVSKPKYAFISTHTGRRTFITLSYEKGMQAEMIMKITGIKKWETLRKYLKVSEKSKLIKMQEFWNWENINTNQCRI